MELRRFASFVAIAETGGISAAADSLGYAQSTVSTQLRALEADLGAGLVRRTPAGSTLTEAGERLLPYAREALRLAERIRRAVQGESAQLRIGALESLAEQWLPDILTAFRLGAAGQPDAPMALSVASRASLAEGLDDGRLDVVFVFDNGVPPTGPHERVDDEEVVLVAAPDHPLAGRRLTRDELARAAFLVAEPGCTADLLVDRLGHDLAGEAPVAMVTGSLGALRRLACNGQGVALLPRLTAAADLATGDLVRLEPPFPVRPVAIEARWRADADPAQLRRIQALVRLARSGRR